MDNLEITISFPKDILADVVEEVAKKALQDEAILNAMVTPLLNILSNINITKDVSRGGARKEFTPPTLEEVAEYNYKNNLRLDARKFWNYYQRIGWKTKSGIQIEDWKAQMETWSLNGIPNVITSPTDPRFSTADKDFNPNEIDNVKIARN